MKPFVMELRDIDPIEAFNAVQHVPYALLLDSADTNHPNGRFSFIVCNPIETIEAKDGVVTIASLNGEQRIESDPFTVIQERINAFSEQIETIEDLPPFQGGAAGFFGYDLGRYLEKLPENTPENADMPDMAVGIYDQVLAYDHEHGKAWLITHAVDDAEARIKQRVILKALENRTAPAPHIPVGLPWESNFDADDYDSAIERVIEYIRAGDIFQANIAQCFEADLPGGFDPYAHYLRLRAVNPAPFSAYFNLGSIKLSSASPERFLTVNDGMVETRPIKGTRPRDGNPMVDKAYKTSLENSCKDRAENVMIVDLLRNDLSKVCEPDSVKVSALCELESFASVHHLVSTITGKLRVDENALSLLRGCFPGGSITGAPKIRSQEIIEEIETRRRGPYCGSIGYIGFDGTMDSSILIRTLVYQGDKVSLHSGSGIVADSNADEEYQETFDKADAIFRSFEDFDYEIEEDFLAIMAGAAE